MATLHKNQEVIADVIRIVPIAKKKSSHQFGTSAPLEELPAIEFVTDKKVDFVEAMGVRYWIDDTTERFNIEDPKPAFVTQDQRHFAYHAYKGHTEKKA